MNQAGARAKAATQYQTKDGDGKVTRVKVTVRYGAGAQVADKYEPQ